MAIWSNRKKTSDSTARGGRGSNQHMLQPKSGEYDPDTDINRSRAIRSLGQAGQSSAGGSVSNNSLKQDIYALSDAISDENPNKVTESESNIRYSTPDFIGSRIVKSVQAESRDDHSLMEEDDEIRGLVVDKSSTPDSIARKTISLKHHLSKDEPLNESEKQDIQDSSEIEARIIKLSDHHSPRDIDDLSNQVKSYSDRRISSVGF